MNTKKWLRQMSADDKKPLHPETNFLPPLKMVLAFFDRDSRQKKAKPQEDSDEKTVEKLIEKLSESEKDR